VPGPAPSGSTTAGQARAQLLEFIAASCARILAAQDADALQESPSRPAGEPQAPQRRAPGLQDAPQPATQRDPAPAAAPPAARGVWGRQAPAKQLFAAGASQQQQRPSVRIPGHGAGQQQPARSPGAGAASPHSAPASSAGGTSYATACSSQQTSEAAPATPQTSRCTSSSVGQQHRTPASSQASAGASGAPSAGGQPLLRQRPQTLQLTHPPAAAPTCRPAPQLAPPRLPRRHP
jgi:hypothetical protein